MSFLLIQLLKELSYPFHFAYSLLPFLFITFYTLNNFELSLQFFFVNITAISLPLRLLITYVHGTVFLNSVITKTFSDQFGVQPFAKMFLYFDILVTSLILNLGSLSLSFLLESTYVFDFTSTGFILIAL